MRSQQHDLVRLAAAPDLADHVGRLRLRPVSASQREADADRLSQPDQPLEHLGVGNGERRRRDLRDLGQKVHRPRVRQPVVIRADRPDEHSGRAEPRRPRGPFRAHIHRVPVPARLGRPLHPLVEENDLPRHGRRPLRVQLFERRHLHDLRLEPSLRRRRAPAKRRQDQLLPNRRRHLTRLHPALPRRHHDLLRMHIGESLRLQSSQRPGDSHRILRRSRKPRPHLIRQPPHPINRPRPRKRPLPQSLGRPANLRRKRRGVGALCHCR